MQGRSQKKLSFVFPWSDENINKYSKTETKITGVLNIISSETFTVPQAKKCLELKLV